MKLLTNNILFLLFIMLISIDGYAKSAPPTPTQRTPGPIGLPIDNNLILLALAGTLFGLYAIHKHKINKKRPA